MEIFMMEYINSSYLNLLLDISDYMHIPLKNIPAEIMEEYKVNQFVSNGFLYFDITSEIYGLPQAGTLQ